MAKVPEDILVVLDEAYVEYVTDPEAVNGLVEWAKYPNLMLLRTFSKAWGLAGLRVGMGSSPGRNGRSDETGWNPDVDSKRFSGGGNSRAGF